MNPFVKKQSQLSIFITAGYPMIDSLLEQSQFLEASGINFIEVGIPFSDPMADGPVIQASSMRAIENGMSVSLLFEQLKTIQRKIPLVIMSYLNPILCFGIESFLEKCVEVGIVHLIIPDISLEVFERDYKDLFEVSGITLCFLITPDTNADRVKRMAVHSRNGFIYLVSSSMTTGNVKSHFQEEKYFKMRAICGSTPMMIGFGIKSRADVERVQKIADGVIVGSAYIRSLDNGEEKEFLRELMPSSQLQSL